MNIFVKIIVFLVALLIGYHACMYTSIILTTFNIPQVFGLIIAWLTICGLVYTYRKQLVRIWNGNFILTGICLLFLCSCNGCEKIPANQIVLNTDNYGQSWRILGKNETVPQCHMAGCYNIKLPATTMTGGLNSIQRIGKPGGSAKVNMLYSYMWEISDPLAFIAEAKELRGGGDYLTDESLEGVENRMLDKIFHDISAEILDEEDVIHFDPALFELRLTAAVNESARKYGVRITAVSVVPEFGDQLETALDAAQALELYRSINEEELGKEVIKAKAGATQINIGSSK